MYCKFVVGRRERLGDAMVTHARTSGTLLGRDTSKGDEAGVHEPARVQLEVVVAPRSNTLGKSLYQGPAAYDGAAGTHLVMMVLPTPTW